MKEFLEECLKDLEAISGLRQLAFWEMEAAKSPDAEKECKHKMKVCIEGMVHACSKFPEIPEDKQMGIIRREMEEDLNYEALNSRTIYKWLNRYRQTSGFVSGISEEEMTPAAPPEIADKYAKQLLANISQIGNGPLQKPLDELKMEVDEETQVSRARSESEYERRQAAIKRLGLDACNLSDLTKFTIEGRVILARSEDEAREYYAEVYI